MVAHLEERTETATPRRKREARLKGQVARSPDLTSAFLILAGFVSLRWLGPIVGDSLLRIMAIGLSVDGPADLESAGTFISALMMEVARSVGPFLLILMALTIVALYAQVGGLFTWQPIVPSLNKINPWTGLQRLFSARSFVAAAVNFLKLLIVGTVAMISLESGAAAVLFAFDLGFHEVIVLGASLVSDLGIRLSIALLILALADYAWQRHRHERELRMTKEEVKDELRSMEGDPHIKRRRRQVQLQLVMQRLRKEVPQADVVISNPTHFAVAIGYDAETMMAPKVLAKGADYLALRIRQIAQQHKIPIVERKPLARALYENVDVGQYVPEKFYRAIAEILAYIYELTGGGPKRLRRQLAAAST